MGNMPSENNFYLPIPELKADIESYSKKLAERVGVPKQSARIQGITEKLYRKPYCQNPFTGHGLALSLEEAFCNLGKDEALGLFEKTDLDALANRVSLMRNWAGGLEPFYTRSELAAEIRGFDGFYYEKRNMLLAYGYPYVYFAFDSFFMRFTFLNPTLDPGWKVQGENSPFANSVNQWDNFGALNFSIEESTFLDDSRIKLHRIKSELCLLFYHAVKHKEHTPQTLCDEAGKLIAKHLDRNEANRLLQLEQRYKELFQYKACVRNEQVGKQAELLLDIGSGGLTAMLNAVLFIAEEIDTTRLHKTKTTLMKLLEGRELSSYYRCLQIMAPQALRKLNKFLDENSDYFNVLANYGKRFEPLLIDSIKKHITIPITVKKEHVDKISHAAKHLEQGGELRLGELAYTATGVKSAKPSAPKGKPQPIVPGKLKVSITGLKRPSNVVIIDGHELQLTDANFLLFLRLAVGLKEGKDGLVLMKHDTTVPDFSHQKVNRLKQELAYGLKCKADIITNDWKGSYGINTRANLVKINSKALRVQDDGRIDAILNLITVRK